MDATFPSSPYLILPTRKVNLRIVFLDAHSFRIVCSTIVLKMGKNSAIENMGVRKIEKVLAKKTREIK